jgi:hypothetical protein
MPTSRWLFNGANNAYIPADGLAPNYGATWKLMGDGQYRKYSTTQKYQGLSSWKSDALDTGAIFSLDTGGWLGDTAAGLYFDFFYYLPAAPASDMALIGGAYFTTNGCFISSDRRLKMKGDDGTTHVQSAANVVPLNEWFRVRAYFNPNGGFGLSSVTVWKAPYLGQDDISAGGWGEVTVAHDLPGIGYLVLNPGSGYIDDLVISSTTGVSFAHLTHGTWTEAAATRSGWGVVK